MRAATCLLGLCVASWSPELFGQLAPVATNAAIAAAAAAAATNGISTSSVVTVVAVPVPPIVVPITVGSSEPGTLPPAPTLVTTPIVPVVPRLTNLSTRARVTSDSPVVAGFAISGATPRTVLVRAAGPALSAFGLAGAVVAPRLRLRNAAGAVLLENAGWGGAPDVAAAMATTGAFLFAPGSADSAAVVTLTPGGYTVEVSDDVGIGGVALTEVYDVQGTAAGSHLVNVSTRSTVAGGGGELVSGFVLAGDGYQTFLLRGVGPGLAPFGVSGVLSDPVIALFDSAGRKIAFNDNWSGAARPGTAATGASPGSGSGIVTETLDPDLVNSASAAAGAFALDPSSYDAAFVTTLAPGAYTVQLTGANVVTVTASTGTSSTNGAIGLAQPAGPLSVTSTPAAPGVALLEIYQLP